MTLCDRCVRARLPCSIRDEAGQPADCAHFMDREKMEQDLAAKMEQFAGI